MAYCGSKPGMCAGDPKCADHYCPGHPVNSDPAPYTPEEVYDAGNFFLDALIWLVIGVSSIAIVIGLARAFSEYLPH